MNIAHNCGRTSMDYFLFIKQVILPPYASINLDNELW